VALVFQVLSLGDIETVFSFAEARHAQRVQDPNQRAFQSWSAKWRKESLEHYLKLGWSFIVRDETTKQTLGFFLAQPVLFFRAQTQTVWVELIEAFDSATAAALIEVAVKVGREKHIQRVIFADADVWSQELKTWAPESLEPTIAVIKTTKN
jgi:hypothetical protein